LPFAERHNHAHGFGGQVPGAAPAFIAENGARTQIETALNRLFHLRHEAYEGHALAIQTQEFGGRFEFPRTGFKELLEGKGRPFRQGGFCGSGRGSGGLGGFW